MSGSEVHFIAPTFHQRMAGVAIGVILIFFTISLLRKFQMKEEQGLPWLIGGAILVLLSLFPSLLRAVTFPLGVGTPATALFAGCILFLITQNLLFSLALSRQKRQIQDLAIEVAVERARQAIPTETTRPEDGEKR
jgi:hypothetical protein